ncbi:MAG TPA: CbiX/SirB N-terminal domain-containing protein [Nitrospira sp.]|nr:CbiX/SirB N-terminal domain-containing protein [Nitrospira sp.]
MKRGVVLVGHGGIPKDCPPELITKLKRLESHRKAVNGPLTNEERELDRRIRHWPRTDQNDPYCAGLEAVASAFRAKLNGTLFALAYNEFCAPTLEESVEEMIRRGATDITVVTTMFTPGGSHSEVEIPETLERLARVHPAVSFRYAWPYDLELVASFLEAQLRQGEPGGQS